MTWQDVAIVALVAISTLGGIALGGWLGTRQ